LKNLRKLSINFQKSIISVVDFFIDGIYQISECFLIQTSSFDDWLPATRMSFLFEDWSAFFDMQRHRCRIKEFIQYGITDDFFHRNI
jgi:hypothetical protein